MTVACMARVTHSATPAVGCSGELFPVQPLPPDLISTTVPDLTSGLLAGVAFFSFSFRFHRCTGTVAAPPLAI